MRDLIRKLQILRINFTAGIVRCTLCLLLNVVTAPLAQSVECFHGKEKVNGSIPLGGSNKLVTKKLNIEMYKKVWRGSSAW